MEIITLTRDQYRLDLQEAARLGALQAMREYKKGDEWIPYDEAKKVLGFKDDAAFRNYRIKNKITGNDKVQTVGRKKLFNKQYLLSK